MDRTKQKSCEICNTTRLSIAVTLAGTHLFCGVCGLQVKGFCAEKGLDETDHAAVMMAIDSEKAKLAGEDGGDFKYEVTLMDSAQIEDSTGKTLELKIIRKTLTDGSRVFDVVFIIRDSKLQEAVYEHNCQNYSQASHLMEAFLVVVEG